MSDGAYANPLLGGAAFSLGGLATPQIIYTVIDKDNEPKPQTGELTGIQGALFASLAGGFPGGGAWGGYGFGDGSFGGSELTGTKGPFGGGPWAPATRASLACLDRATPDSGPAGRERMPTTD